MKFYSHSKVNSEGKTYGSKELKDHISGVKEKAFHHFSPGLSLGFSDEELRELLEVVINLHDFGKYTSYFQNYLLKTEPIDYLLKKHAQIGGFTAYHWLKEKDEKQALLALYLIFLHHSQLVNLTDVSEKLDDNLARDIAKQQQDIQSFLNFISEDLATEEISSLVRPYNEKDIRKGFRYWEKKNATIQDYFLINYLFSLLIEGDKLDASDTIPYTLKSINPASVDKRFGEATIEKGKLEHLSNNVIRNFCRATVVSNLEREDILDHFIFTLTAPTGIGKTMTALDFALKLKDKIKQKLGKEAHIIYALPFINIIEQALKEYQETLKDQSAHILGHYQYADIFGKNEATKNNDGAEPNYNQRLMAMDTWQADIIITSFVQFFETLIGNRNKLLKKFNHFADAIIILDEVQTLRLEQMPLLGATLFYLSKFLKSRIILMTATRPKIFELAQQEILNDENEKVEPLELLGNYEKVFSLFNRTAIHPLLDSLSEKPENRIQDFVANIFSQKWNSEKSCLIVCNTVKLSILLYQQIEEYLQEKDLENPIFYLSTNIIPAQRFERITDIKEAIQKNKAPILIATQVVEAGVDLDFDMGFRDVGPIDSIIQVAGRINRNNDKSRAHSPLYIVDFDESMTKKVYGRMAYEQALKALRQQEVFEEKEYLKLIEAYFDGIANRSSFDDAKQFFKSMKTLKYDDEDKKTLPISAFRIIKESDRYAPVFIEVDNEASALLEKYRQKITKEISSEEYNRDWKLKFQQHIISVPKFLCEDLETVNEFEENILLVPIEELNTRYDFNTGYNRNRQDENTAFVF